MKINITTPSSCILEKYHRYFQGFNVQLIVNQDQFINIVEVFNKSMDYGLLSPMYKKECDFLNEDKLSSKLLCDSGYWSLNDIELFDPENGYLIIMPSPELVKEERKQKTRAKGYERYRFKYNPDKDIYKCPNGDLLHYTKSYKRKNNRPARVYKAVSYVF